MQAFTKQTNADLIPIIRKEFDFAKLRDDLNVVTTVFDEDTQLTIDRASRGCAAAQPAPPRAPRAPGRPPALTPRPPRLAPAASFTT